MLEAVFPFHLVLDRNLRVLQAGGSIQRLHGQELVGAGFTEHFRVATPRVKATFDAMIVSPRALFLLESLTTPGLMLRGQVLHEQGSDCLFFVGSPWITETANFVALGLTLDDFAASDSVVDYVLLLAHQASALVEAEDLAARLHVTAELLEHRAYHDTLTGLPNRALLREHLERSRPERGAPTPVPVSVLMLDLDGFKAVNDSYGHSAGDWVLSVVAERLQDIAREGDMVVRFGGDEFALVLDAPAGKEPNETSAARVAQRVIETLSRPIPLPSCPGVFVTLSASIGIAHRLGLEPAEDLLRNADLAMYAAKAAGKARYERYTPAMHTVSQRRLDLAGDLGRALEQGQLRLDYQPMLRLDGDRFAGAEALLRWLHPTRGLLGPYEFIEIAEETGAIVEIGAWVLDEACRELRTWREAYTGHQPLGVAVNISGRQLGPHLVDTVTQALEGHGIEPDSLTLEITEGIIAEGERSAQKTLRALKELGGWLAIDDFGTGH
jgi:diguanylate cyclase (GGDEF)-like protein